MSQWRPYTYEEMCSMTVRDQDTAWDRLVTEYAKLEGRFPYPWGGAASFETFSAMQQRVLVIKAQRELDRAIKRFIEASL